MTRRTTSTLRDLSLLALYFACLAGVGVVRMPDSRATQDADTATEAQAAELDGRTESGPAPGSAAGEGLR